MIGISREAPTRSDGGVWVQSQRHMAQLAIAMLTMRFLQRSEVGVDAEGLPKIKQISCGDVYNHTRS